jgi:RNA polymerase sigma factor (sigma-70 family)
MKAVNVNDLVISFIEHKDEAIFNKIVSLIGDNIKKYLQYIIKSNDIVDDICSITYMDMWEKTGKYFNPEKSNYIVWVYGLAYRNAINYIRSTNNDKVLVPYDIDDILMFSPRETNNKYKIDSAVYEIDENYLFQTITKVKSVDKEYIFCELTNVFKKYIQELPDELRLIVEEKMLNGKGDSEIAILYNMDAKDVHNKVHNVCVGVRRKLKKHNKEFYNMVNEIYNFV